MKKYTLLAVLIIIIVLIGYYGLPEKKLPLPGFDKSQLIKGAEPIFLKGSSDKAVLLIHGLRSSPQSLEYLGKKLHGKGYTVIIPLLPGHGTNYENFAKTRFYHWYDAAYQEAVRCRGKYKKFYIGGLSMGGTIALRLLEELRADQRPDAAVLISAPVFFNKISPEVVHVYDVRLFFSGIIKIFVKKVADAPISKREFEIVPEIMYQNFHIPDCVHSLQKAMRKVDRNLSLVKTPVLLLQSKGDKTVPEENLEYIYNHISSPRKEKYIFDLTYDKVTRRHELTLNRGIKDEVAEKVIEFLQRN